MLYSSWVYLKSQTLSYMNKSFSFIAKQKQILWQLHEKTPLMSLLYIFIQTYKSINPLWLCFYNIYKCQSIVSIGKMLWSFSIVILCYIWFYHGNVIVISLVLHFNLINSYNWIEMSFTNRKGYMIISWLNES